MLLTLFFLLLSCVKGLRVSPNKRANITRSVYIFPLLAIYDFLEKRQRKRDVRRVSFRSLLAVRKTAPHFRFCLSVFRLERHAVGKLCRLLSSSETVLCAMLEKPKSALFSCLFLSWFRHENGSTQDCVCQGRLCRSFTLDGRKVQRIVWLTLSLKCF